MFSMTSIVIVAKRISMQLIYISRQLTSVYRIISLIDPDTMYMGMFLAFEIRYYLFDTWGEMNIAGNFPYNRTCQLTLPGSDPEYVTPASMCYSFTRIHRMKFCALRDVIAQSHPK